MGIIITGILGVGIFVLFVGGLAESIGVIPFMIIVGIVGVMAVTAVWQDVRDEYYRKRR
jgi:hypothetical protein